MIERIATALATVILVTAVINRIGSVSSSLTADLTITQPSRYVPIADIDNIEIC